MLVNTGKSNVSGLSAVSDAPAVWGGYISFIVLADAHFSHDTPRNCVFDLPFPCCP
jgi:hypothetical protein